MAGQAVHLPALLSTGSSIQHRPGATQPQGAPFTRTHPHRGLTHPSTNKKPGTWRKVGEAKPDEVLSRSLGLIQGELRSHCRVISRDMAGLYMPSQGRAPDSCMENGLKRAQSYTCVVIQDSGQM